MAAELVEYRLHRYLVARATQRSREARSLQDAAGGSLDATFEVEHEAGTPIAIHFQSAGGVAGSPSARNVDYVAGLDLLLVRMRDLGLTIEDAYVDSTRTIELPVADRRLSTGGAHYPVTLASLDDVEALRRALLRSMAKVGRAPDAKGGGNARKAFRLIISGATATAAELADSLSTGKPGVVQPEHEERGTSA
jgi:hypothetical protein